VSRRNRELLLLVVAGAIATVAYVSVYAGRFHEISRWSIVYAGIFVVIFALLHVVVRVWLPQADPYPLPLAALLSSLGLAEIYRLDPDLALLQGRWLVVGAVLFILTVLVVRDHLRLDGYRYLIGALGLLLLLVTILAGTTVNGAKLWIRVAGFSFQPSEFAKIAIVIFLAGYLNDNKEVLSVPTAHVLGVPLPPVKYFGPLAIMWVLSLALLVFMKDFGMSLLLMAAFVALIYMATSRIAYVVLGGALFAGGAALAVKLVSHVHERVTVWIDPWSHATTSGYQVLQSLFTISDGGLVGAGLGRGFLLFSPGHPVVPDMPTDFIFAAVANELGLLGGVGLLLCYLVFTWRGFTIAVRATDGFSKLLAAGLSVTFAVQTFLIVGGVTRLIPLTGITLPFVSYGGSSLLANLMLVALLLMVSHRTNVVLEGSETERLRLARLGGGRLRGEAKDQGRNNFEARVRLLLSPGAR
jgi:cell division protein FtsW (lipid II flippase)